MRRPLLVALLLVIGCGDEPVAPYDPSATIVPDETADAEALADLVDWQGLPLLRERIRRHQGSTDRDTGEPPPVAFLDHGNRDMNNFVCRGARAVADDDQLVPLRFDRDRCQRDEVRGVVLSRFEGAGVMVRFWMTALSLRSSIADDEMLRIYVDDADVPFVQAPLSDFLDGSAGEIFAPPFGAGSTEFAAWHYPIVFEKELVVALDGLGPLDLYYHQTDVISAGDGRRASPARLDARDAAAVLLADPEVLTASAQPLVGADTVSVAAMARTTLADVRGPATVDELVVDVAEADLPVLADVSVEVSWDGADEPALSLPLLELFAAADAVPGDGHALAATRDGGRVALSLRLPMPFAEGALFEVDSASDEAVEVSFALLGRPAVPDGRWGHLHVERRETSGPTTDPRHPVADRSGPGRLAGVCLMLEGHAIPEGGAFAGGLNFLEGDERIVVDGDPVVLGTGTEDYLDSAFYFQAGPHAGAFTQAWGIAEDDMVEPPSGRVSACRWHVLTDAVEYARSLQVDLEIGPGDPSVLDRYRSIAFVYE
jgi:hypothetical protein